MAIVIVIAMITVMGVAMEYNSRRLKFSTFGKNFRPVGVATMDYCNGVVVDERTLCSVVNNSVRQVGIR